MAVALAAVSRLATLVAASATWLATALMARSATTAVKLDTFPAIAPPKPRVNACVTTASNLDTFRLPALTSLNALWTVCLLSRCLAWDQTQEYAPRSRHH
ncbi:hypothetical protein BO82DRAFT_358550 [Aspergillus uvarum CBS 121591]|uniref:Uncharacterized protein n=1 Tax=Aspergillus uvarum CBS 121591 TaxID=1448315 RepID=A0A319BWS3_9EURO|nr:hypothetical protein BO82DRAFT_358550 [Aspergillus uvarum CBS 121591]PYH77154.1 hypothetical protein BO82DRAFT_358550 [Aspergillus uvarum CBS 121591]